MVINKDKKIYKLYFQDNWEQLHKLSLTLQAVQANVLEQQCTKTNI